ncbi:D-glycero-beta-D-manno-heptose-7-phosphate kinase [Nemorincola caseinilytica]|uniref:D-glycero-beta-D-manno-heptose-7-phosphate kinase n=1 Tax=Nemorincola caseinilytica TaxID=2054315 RepID=A0ABP8NII8_9BACT
MNKERSKELFARMQDMHVVVVGDVMLDNYWWGHVDRISPEAPVPVVAISRRESRLGGAANVALNCRSLGAKVTLASIVGEDANGETLVSLANDAGIDTSLVAKSRKRLTTTKVRILSRNQQMLRLDDEVTDDLHTEEEHPFIDKVLQYLQKVKPQALIFEDYNKGVLKENVIRHITAHCREIGIVTVVDPKRRNFLSYKDVTIFKPNLKEVREGLHLDINNVTTSELDEAHTILHKELGHEVTFITLSEKGVYYNKEGHSAILPSHIRNIADVSGAGDTVVATATLVYTLTKDPALMAAISNIAGGIVCEEAGVVAIDKNKLREECCRLLPSQ